MAEGGATGAAGTAPADMGRLRSRPARPEDYDAIAAVVNRWWGRPVLAALPRLFLDHFHNSSLVVDGPDGPMAFLIGILSPARPRRRVRPGWAGGCTRNSSPWRGPTGGAWSAR
jgi:hypothetical protein